MHKNIIKNRLKKYCIENSIENEDWGFLKFVNEVFYNGTQEELDDSVIDDFIVDGQSDKQIDLIQIEEEDIITIRIIQVKNKNGFESNVVILLKNGLDWIFNREDDDLETLTNISFKNKILEVRDIISNNDLQRIYIDVIYVTLGNKDDLRETDEIIEEINSLERTYRGSLINFTFSLYGAKDLCNYMESKNDKSIDIDLEIIYDTNVPSIINNNYNSIKSLTCNIKASELIKIFNIQKSEYLFEQNVRKYLGNCGKVNQNIIDTASSDDSEYFLALNNGVTIICDTFTLKIVGGSATVSMKNLNIINGCQTSMALYKAYKDKKLKDNTSLLLRVHETNDTKIIDKIILSTNNQNPINPRDLVSNTSEQIELQKYFYEMYDVIYQRKRNDYIDLNGNEVPRKMVTANDKVGQAALACIKCIPNIALGSKGKIFTTHYDVFRKDKDSIVLSIFIYEKVLEFTKSILVKNSPEKLSTLKFGRFHIAYLIYKEYAQNINLELNKQIRLGEISLDNYIITAIDMLDNGISDEQRHNLLGYFKSKESVDKIKNLRLNDQRNLEVAGDELKESYTIKEKGLDEVKNYNI